MHFSTVRCGRARCYRPCVQNEFIPQSNFYIFTSFVLQFVFGKFGVCTIRHSLLVCSTVRAFVYFCFPRTNVCTQQQHVLWLVSPAITATESKDNSENKMVYATHTAGISQNQILSFNSYAILLQCMLFGGLENIIVFELNCGGYTAPHPSSS